MVDAINGMTSGTEVDASHTARASTSSSFLLDSAVSQSIADGVKGISPRLSLDPVSGVLITEYLSSEGQVEMQLPSEAAVAYLRSGLTQNGQVVRDPVSEKKGSDVIA